MRAIGCAVLGAVNADASKGNVTLTGSSLTAGITDGVYNGAGTAIIAATGNVNINEAREEHDSYQAIESKRGNFVSGSTTDTTRSTQANIGVSSTVSGDRVQIKFRKDRAIQCGNTVAANEVSLAAAGSVSIAASQDTLNSQSTDKGREYGFRSGLNPLNPLDGGLVGYSIACAGRSTTSRVCRSRTATAWSGRSMAT